MAAIQKNFIRFLICLVFLCRGTGAGAQDSRQGYWIPLQDTLRIYLIFAELVNDPDDPGNIRGWTAGSLPPDPGYLFDHRLVPGELPRGMVTKYFYQASFGRFIVLADYHPEIVSLDFDRVRGRGLDQVLGLVAAEPGEDLISFHGYSVNEGDFDHITTSRFGQEKQIEPDGLVDMVMVIWRVNSKMTRDLSAGFCSTSLRMFPFKEMRGMNSYSSFVMKNYTHYPIIRHEFSHLLLGGNNFHTGGAGAGTKTFMSSAGGYAMLSSYDRSSPVYCAFDRRRLGWKPKDNVFQISARDADSREETKGDLEYGRDFGKGSGELILRDFVETGDAVRIRLPYLKTFSEEIQDQWLWLENHQKKEGNIDHDGNTRRGLYAYIQVGKETLSGQGTFGGNCNYTWPLSAFGNYDLQIDEEKMEASAIDRLSNPFTGVNNLVRGAYDLKEKDGIIYRDELFTAKNLKVNGRTLDSSDFNVLTYPLFGTSLDAFRPGDRIAVDRNPAPVPVLTYRTSSGRRARPGPPVSYDNRRIHLNGISVDFLEQLPDGSIRLRIRWDANRLQRDVRWCGDIYLHEELVLGTRVRMLLDRGLTPQRPIDPDTLEGKPVFTDPTSLTLSTGSRLQMEKRSTIILDNQSSLRLAAGSSLTMERGARLILRDSGNLRIEPGGRISGRGKIILHRGAALEAENGEPDVKVKKSRR